MKRVLVQEGGSLACRRALVRTAWMFLRLCNAYSLNPIG